MYCNFLICVPVIIYNGQVLQERPTRRDRNDHLACETMISNEAVA